MTATQFWCYVAALEKEEVERKADHWYMAQVALEVDRLRDTVGKMFSARPVPYRKTTKDFLIPFVMEGSGREERPRDEPVPGAYTAPSDVDPEADRVRRERLSAVGISSWKRFLEAGKRKGKLKVQRPPLQKKKREN